MLPPETTSAARAAAVMVRIHGPDPKGKKMRQHAFHHSESGDTTLSASGWILYDAFETTETNFSSVVLTCASIVEPFLQKNSRFQSTPMLIPGAEIDILMENLDQMELAHQLQDRTYQQIQNSSFFWLPAKFISLVDVPLAGTALQTLLDVHGGSLDGTWEVGWALAQMETSRPQGVNSSTHKEMEGSLPSDSNGITERISNSGNLAFATTRIAVLSLQSPPVKIKPKLVLSKPCRRGDFLFIIGSPFGALSPLHFFNSMVVGVTANCWPPASSQSSLLMADLRCLPGMEGAPAFNRNGAFVGMLARPIRQRGGGAEVQLVITWEALAPALQNVGISLLSCAGKADDDNVRSSVEHDKLLSRTDHLQLSSSIDKAVASVVLVTVGDGAWASGVLINDKGLILTNAHLLEPWRFGKTPFSQSQSDKELYFLRNDVHSDVLDNGKTQVRENMGDCNSRISFKNKILGMDMTTQADQVSNPRASDAVVAQPTLEINYRSYRKIRVRLEHPLPRSWYGARAVYISRGPLDVALLQLDIVPDGIVPITPEEECPTPGTSAVVIGHGLFGPRSELCPSLSAGVVSRVVKAKNVSQLGSGGEEDSPAMLETTASVHPGGSGGAVINEHGRMIGLVTSNARHSGGTVIPHLNFSIPFAALKPIFLYASGDMKDTSLLSTLGNPNEQLSAVWALVPPTPPRPTKVLPFLPRLPSQDNTSLGKQLKTTGEKGSRFAKFISEKTAEFSEGSKPLKTCSDQTVTSWLEPPSKLTVPGQSIHSRL